MRQTSPKISRRVVVPAFLLVLLALPACTPPASLESLLQQHRESTVQTGAAPLQSMEARVGIVEPTFSVSGHYVAQRPDWARIDIYVEEQLVFSESHREGSAWQRNGGAEGEVSVVSEAGRQALQRGAHGNLYTLDELGDLGYELELVGLQELPPALGSDSEELESLWLVLVTSPNGQREEVYLDPEQCLVRRTRRRVALHPDVDPTEALTETQYLDYRWVDGHRRNFLMVKHDLDSGDKLQETTLQSVQVNPNVDAAIFDSP